jgi:hypothetical protein
LQSFNAKTWNCDREFAATALGGDLHCTTNIPTSAYAFDVGSPRFAAIIFYSSGGED